MTKRIWPILLVLLGCLAVLCVAIAFVFPRGGFTNPPVAAEPPWNSPRTRELFFRDCGDCHSNQTAWPWYSRIPFVSALVQNDTFEGRARFNVSEWGRPENEGGESAELFQNGKMPPPMYLLMHPSARLDAGEKQELSQGLLATFGGEQGEGGESGEGEGGE